MAKLNLDYYRGEDLYSDGDVENEILEIAKSGAALEDLQDVKFPVLYHLSRVRENILNWYPFRQGACALEIGSGCGAITGLLCRKLARVVSVELSRRRADINFARHKELDNLELCVGNLNDMEFGTQFDYVVLNGVFEYAMGFTEGGTPYETFLENIKRFLKPDGIILIAIENRLGLKYFAGAPEDHTNAYFDGIRGYEGNTSVRTFSRSEWEQLMRRCGLCHYKFYYPYPDYKFPREIFTDVSLKEQKYGSPAWNFTKYRMALFSEEKIAATLQQEGVMAQFANSFLIEMSREPLNRKAVSEDRGARKDRPASESGIRPGEKEKYAAGPEVLYAKLSTDRAKEFSIMTLIEEADGERFVVKTAAEPEASAHVEKLSGRVQSYEKWQPLAGSREGSSAACPFLRGKSESGGVIYPFLRGKSLGQQAAGAIQKKDIVTVKALIQKASELCDDAALRHVSRSEMTAPERDAFRKVFGDGEIPGDAVCVAPANIDLILDNIFEPDAGTDNGTGYDLHKSAGKYQVIDCEWMFDFPVPVSFMLWRAVNELYSVHPALDALYPRSALWEEHGITQQMADTFWKWSTYFAETYVGANRLLQYSTPEIGISIEEFRQKFCGQEYLNCQVFVDTGNGFSEEEKAVAEVPLIDGRFSAEFDLAQFRNIRALRFDPIEGKPCICRIEASGTTGQLTAANAAARVEAGDLFLTTDPIYHVKLSGGTSALTVSGRIQVLSMEEVLAHADALLPKHGSRLAFWRKH